MKKLGDLGNIRFVEKPPENWPKPKMACKNGEIGGYGIFNHINLVRSELICML